MNRSEQSAVRLTAQPLLITTRCSGGCAPCPFASGRLPQKYMTCADVLNHLKASTAPLVVITGGEPFEHPHVEEIITELAQVSTPFRIATGGHIALSDSIARLHRSKGFQGISLGTDVLSDLSEHCREHTLTWKRNIRILEKNKIRYSLSLTLNPDFNAFDVLQTALNCGAQPEFIYLRIPVTGASSRLPHSRSAYHSTLVDFIRRRWKNIEIIEDILAS